MNERNVFSIAEAPSVNSKLLREELGYWLERFTEVGNDRQATAEDLDVVSAIIKALEYRSKKVRLREQYGRV